MKITKTQKDKFLAILYRYCQLIVIVVVAMTLVFSLIFSLNYLHNCYVASQFFSQLEIDVNEVNLTTNP